MTCLHLITIYIFVVDCQFVTVKVNFRELHSKMDYATFFTIDQENLVHGGHWLYRFNNGGTPFLFAQFASSVNHWLSLIESWNLGFPSKLLSLSILNSQLSTKEKYLHCNMLFIRCICLNSDKVKVIISNLKIYAKLELMFTDKPIRQAIAPSFLIIAKRKNWELGAKD